MHTINNISVGSMVIDRDAREVSIDGQTIYLTNAEFTLLTTLADSPRRAFSSEHLTRVLTDSEWVGEVRALQVTVSRLRRKLGESGNQPRRIVTVHGYGYRYEPDKGPDLAEAMASNALLTSCNHSTQSSFALIAIDRTILWASESFMHLLGWQSSELEDTHLCKLFHPSDLTHVMSAREDLDKGLPAASVLHLRSATGEYRLVEALARPIIDTCGQLTCFLNEFRPATTAQITELALPESIQLKHITPHDALVDPRYLLLGPRVGTPGCQIRHD